VLFGGVELDLTTRQCTGRSFLVEIDRKDRLTLETEIRKRIYPGALIWTDGYSSYKWLGQGQPFRGALSPYSNYCWDWVNHSAGEFSRVAEYGSGERVSTNGFGSLFSRLKKHLRQSKITKVHRDNYCIYLGEFLLRDKYLNAASLGTSNRRPYAFWLLCDHLAKHFRGCAIREMLAEARADVPFQIDAPLVSLFDQLRHRGPLLFQLRSDQSRAITPLHRCGVQASLHGGGRN
jgi:IS1 family transposase